MMSRARGLQIGDGLRFARMPQSGDGQDVAGILGDAYILDYNAMPEFWTPGTPPDVASAANQGLYGSGADIAQPATVDRPHGVVEDGLEVWQGGWLRAEEVAPNISEIGDQVSVTLVSKYISGTVLANVALGIVTANAGIQLLVGGGDLQARALFGGMKNARFAFADTANFYVMRATVTDADVELWLNGVMVATTPGTGGGGGLDTACDTVAWGADVRGALDGPTYTARGPIYAVGATADQLADLDEFLINRYLP